jgi:hypothetical protein
MSDILQTVRARAKEAGLPIKDATEIREIAPYLHLDMPHQVFRPSTSPEARTESEYVFLIRPFSQQMGKADLVMGYAPLADVLVYFRWTLDK